MPSTKQSRTRARQLPGTSTRCVELGEPVKFKYSTVESLAAEPDHAGAVRAFVSADPSRFDTKPERINVGLPRFVPSRIGEHVKARRETRSGFLARAAPEALSAEEREFNITHRL
ncbi:hypothetical protein BGL_2c27860 [Burkholderia plantarii]|uniref:HicB-like antitoxin of toxin-antitoxin system domain-containing protein n=1 Tax=Burkholderia plantarii TaxID=41899 RepID=A0A0B6SC66_BURPL|nr:hypothetical protein BGL_2c27860 [Burkholderia plantarii]